MKCDAFTSTVSPLWIRDGRQVSSASIVGTCSTSPQPPFAMAASAIWLLIFPVHSRSTIQSRSSQTAIYDGGESSQGAPYVTKELTPEVAGVIVIAEGGDDPVAVENIIEAVQALFEIDTHKIKVMKRN